MSVKIKASDIAAQWGRYRAAQRTALEVTGRFERAPSLKLWREVGEAEAALQSEWQAYQLIAPAKMRSKAA